MCIIISETKTLWLKKFQSLPHELFGKSLLIMNQVIRQNLVWFYWGTVSPIHIASVIIVSFVAFFQRENYQNNNLDLHSAKIWQSHEE